MGTYVDAESDFNSDAELEAEMFDSMHRARNDEYDDDEWDAPVTVGL